jgi:plastocyanin
VTGFNGLIEDTGQVGMGSTIRDGGLNGKHEVPDPYGLRPQRVRIEAGKSITWTNNTTLSHSATATDGSWTTGEIKPGGTAAVKFVKPGTYVYICTEHPFTYGEITVE